MTQEEIIEMAREADLDWHTGWTLDDEVPNRFETFANLVAAKEREACAKTVETFGTWDMTDRFAAAIRARKETV